MTEAKAPQFKVSTSPDLSGMGTQVLFNGVKVDRVVSVEVVNSVSVDHGKTSRITIELYEEVEVIQAAE